MTTRQQIELRLSTVKVRLNEISRLEGDQLTDEVRGEASKLQEEYKGLETRFQAAVASEGDTTTTTRTTESTEDRQRRELVAGADMGRIFGAILEHRQVDGREQEMQTEFGLASNQVPLAMLRGEEHRAVTPAPANVGANQAAIIPGVFPDSVAAFLGIDMPTVGVGEAVFPVLTKNAEVKTPAENAEADETTGSFSAEILTPSRLQASFFYSREDRARFAGMDAALRQNLNEALSDGLDNQVVAGDDGLLEGTNLANHNVTATTSYALYRSQLAWARVDGKYATSAEALRIVMGSGTYAHAASQYRGNADNQDALQSLMAATGGIRVSAHVPAVVSNKQNAIIRLGMRRDMVAPVWEGVSLIPDEITKAKAGQIVVTAVMLHAVKILRSGGFYKQQTQHA